MSEQNSDRRRFLKKSAALAGLAVGAMRTGSAQTSGGESSENASKGIPAYGQRSPFEQSGRGGAEPLNPLQNSMGIITPSGLHFVVNRWRDRPPDIDPRKHRLLIHGMVDRPLIFTMDELKRLPSVSRIHFLECAGNSANLDMRTGKDVQHTHGLTSCSEWTGVPLSLLLREVGVQKDASWILAESADAGKHSKSLPLAKAMDDILVAYGQNGEALRPEQGYPLRLIVPGWEGVCNVKFLRRIKVVDQPAMDKLETTGYATLWPSLKGKARVFQYEMGPKSVITYPSGGQKLSGSGFYEITGLAWSGKGSIRKVEVSTDGGQTWKDAQLQEPIHRIAHTRFRMPWNWTGEEAVLQSRCTDDQGNVQPTLAEISKVWGVTAGYWRTSPNHANHFNAIFPWKITREGSVQNALV